MVEPVEPLAVVIEKLESVDVSAKVKAISRLLVVVIVLPLLYAVCRFCEVAEQSVTWLEPSRHSWVEPLPAIPFNVRNESASPVKVTPLVPDGVRLV